MEIELLQEIGINKSEVKVYLALLEIGSSTTGPIMDKAKISSSKIYEILSRLIEKGLVSTIINSKTKYYQASSPDTLIDYLEDKKNMLNEKEVLVRKLIPQLKLKQNMQGNKQEAQIYSGWKGVMNAYNFMLDNLKKGDDYTAFAQTQHEEESKDVQLFFAQYQKRREQKNIHVKLIADKSQKNVFNKKPYTDFKNFGVKYIDNCPPGTIIGNENIFISAFEPIPVGVIISSKEIARSFKIYFNKEWSKAS